MCVFFDEFCNLNFESVIYYAKYYALHVTKILFKTFVSVELYIFSKIC